MLYGRKINDQYSATGSQMSSPLYILVSQVQINANMAFYLSLSHQYDSFAH